VRPSGLRVVGTSGHLQPHEPGLITISEANSFRWFANPSAESALEKPGTMEVPTSARKRIFPIVERMGFPM